MRRWTLLFVASLSVAAGAQEKDGLARDVESVLRAAKDGERDVLARHARADEPGVWRLAHELCSRGEFDAALALAATASPGEVQKLPAYIERRRGKPDDATARSTLRKAEDHLNGGNGQAVLDLTGSLQLEGDSLVEVRLLEARALALLVLDRVEEGADALLVAGTAAQELGDLSTAADCFDIGGGAAQHCHRILLARECSERLTDVQHARGNVRGEIEGLGRVATTYQTLGQMDPVVSVYERLVEVARDAGDKALEVRSLAKLVTAHNRRGDGKTALPLTEKLLTLAEELGDEDQLGFALVSTGGTYGALGDHEQSLAYFRRALAIREKQGQPVKLAMVLFTMGMACNGLGKLDEAAAHLERAGKLFAQANHPWRGYCLRYLGNIHEHRKEWDKARAYHEQAFEAAKKARDPRMAAAALSGMADVRIGQEQYEEAIPFLEQVLQLSTQFGQPGMRIHAHAALANCMLGLEKPKEALAHAKPATEMLLRMYAGLGDEQGAEARASAAWVFSMGAQAARDLDDVASTFHYMESGRAASLLESLGGRAGLQRAAVAGDLQAAEMGARATLELAREQLRRATATQNLKLARASREEVDAAEEALKDAIQRIQREAKAAAGVLYPVICSLEEIQSELAPADALVLFGLYSRRGMALVVTAKQARIVRLGPREPIDEVCAALALGEKDVAPDTSINRLRELVVAPLALDDSVGRVLVSPHGPLSYVPFCTLLDERDVVYVPSGTTYRILRVDRGRRGKKTLALGDPAYDGELEPLPHTRAEAKAIGDVTLLGGDATKEGLAAALGKQERWRAVHLACHGLVDPDRPTLSSLALTGGRLSAYEVMRMPFASDLAVLSACETGKGKIVSGEGVLGLTRAFMLAGSPRVIVSLWPVEDAATQALMKRFYELWRRKNMPAAAALREAQEHVRGQEKWKHPVYWAAWQLWGLPD